MTPGPGPDRSDGPGRRGRLGFKCRSESDSEAASRSQESPPAREWPAGPSRQPGRGGTRPGPGRVRPGQAGAASEYYRD